MSFEGRTTISGFWSRLTRTSCHSPHIFLTSTEVRCLMFWTSPTTSARTFDAEAQRCHLRGWQGPAQGVDTPGTYRTWEVGQNNPPTYENNHRTMGLELFIEGCEHDLQLWLGRVPNLKRFELQDAVKNPEVLDPRLGFAEVQFSMATS